MKMTTRKAFLACQCAVAIAVSAIGGMLCNSTSVKAAEEYTQVEWIDIRHPGANDFIETDVNLSNIPDSNDSYTWTLVASDFELNTNATQASSFVGFYSSGKRTGYFYCEPVQYYGGSLEHFGIALGDATIGSSDCRFDISASNTKYTISTTVNGLKKGTGPDKNFSASVSGSNGYSHNYNGTWKGDFQANNFKIISCCDDSERMSMKFYSLKITIGGELKGDFIPVIRESDKKVGIYNKVTDTFFAPAGDYDHGPKVDDHKPVPTGGSCSCDHDFEWQVITAPTDTSFGIGGFVCTKCGETRDSRELAPTELWASMKIDRAESGSTLVMEFDNWNSYPLWLMQKIAAKPDVTYVFKYDYQFKHYEVTIRPGQKFALDCDWYGPLKMAGLFETKITEW